MFPIRYECHRGLIGASTENWRSVVRIPAMTQIFLSKINIYMSFDIKFSKLSTDYYDYKAPRPEIIYSCMKMSRIYCIGNIQDMSKFPLQALRTCSRTKRVKICIGTHVRKRTAPRYKQNTTISHVDLFHFCFYCTMFFLLGPLTRRALCDDQRLQHNMNLIYKTPVVSEEDLLAQDYGCGGCWTTRYC